MKIEQLFTRTVANEGTRMFVSLPDGTPTEEWILVLHEDSDKFSLARDMMMRTLSELSGLEGEERVLKASQRRVQLTAAMVGDWSFETPCTPENIIKLLTESPTLREKIDKFGSDQRNFFKKSQTTSAPLENQSSDS